MAAYKPSSITSRSYVYTFLFFPLSQVFKLSFSGFRFIHFSGLINFISFSGGRMWKPTSHFPPHHRAVSPPSLPPPLPSLPSSQVEGCGSLQAILHHITELCLYLLSRVNEHSKDLLSASVLGPTRELLFRARMLQRQKCVGSPRVGCCGCFSNGSVEIVE